MGSSISADFNLVIGTENSTALPHKIFDRILMLNVFHEIESREGTMMEIHQLLNEHGVRSSWKEWVTTRVKYMLIVSTQNL